MAHLILHNWVPVKNGANEHGIMSLEIGIGYLAWHPNGYDGYGSDVQVTKITPTGAPKSSIVECSWEELSDEEVEALVDEGFTQQGLMR
jgi:hypothetical protein